MNHNTIGIIKGMINNSTWVDPENNNVYKFFNINDLAINGENHSHYALNKRNDKIAIELGSKQVYFVEFVNDFQLIIYNNDEKFRIVPA
jgi:hypothetical protein